MSDKNLVDRVFEAELAWLAAESEIGDALDAIVGDPAWEHFTTDYYDRSIEVYLFAAPSDPDAIACALAAHGFRLVWVHPHPSPRGDCRCPVRSGPRP